VEGEKVAGHCGYDEMIAERGETRTAAHAELERR